VTYEQYTSFVTFPAVRVSVTLAGSGRGVPLGRLSSTDDDNDDDETVRTELGRDTVTTGLEVIRLLSCLFVVDSSEDPRSNFVKSKPEDCSVRYEPCADTFAWQERKRKCTTETDYKNTHVYTNVFHQNDFVHVRQVLYLMSYQDARFFFQITCTTITTTYVY